MEGMDGGRGRGDRLSFRTELLGGSSVAGDAGVVSTSLLIGVTGSCNPPRPDLEILMEGMATAGVDITAGGVAAVCSRALSSWGLGGGWGLGVAGTDGDEMM